MKPILLIACLALTGCQSTFRYPSGIVAAKIGSNVSDFKFEGGGIKVEAKRIDNATPTYVALAGTTDITAAAAGGIFAFGAPAMVNGATRAAVLLTQHVTPRVQRASKPIPFTPVGVP